MKSLVLVPARGLFSSVVIALALSACAFTPHDVGITAKAPTDVSSVGNGTNIVIELVDDRESTTVGQRGAQMMGADITASQIVSTLENELIAGFEAKGFNVVENSNAADAEVEARLRAFKFFIETGFFVGAENTSVAIGIEGKKDGDDYDRVYRSSSDEDALVVPAASSIDEKLNASLTDVLNKIFSDKELLEFLAR